MGSLECGGQETTVMSFYRNIDRSKIQFDFLITVEGKNYYEDEALSLGARVFKRPMRTKSPVGNMLGLIRLLKAHPEFKVVHIHNSTTVIAIDTILALLCGIPVRIAHSRNVMLSFSLLHKVFQPLLKATATHWMCCSTEAGLSMFGARAVMSKKFQCFPNARDLSPFRFSQDRRSLLRQDMGLVNHFVIISVGRLEVQKNQHFLLDLIDNTNRKDSSVVLLVVGEGSLHNELVRRADELGLGRVVRFLGRRDDVPDLLQAADIFILPSFYEGLPGVVIEAQASGLPCMISNTVTRECKLTDSVEFLPIDKGSEPWAEKILSYKGFDRHDTLADIRTAGYDIRDAAKKMEEFYLAELLPFSHN